MFYSQDILQKRGGKFSKIWLAATKMCKMNRREVASVHVTRSCDEILEYVEVRVAPGPSGKRPRFSLYLSALLMYGVVRIHQKQLEYLLEDVSTALIRLTKSLGKIGAVEDIDLQTEMREDLVTNPEFEVTEGEFQEIMEFHFLSDDELTILLGRPDPEFWRLETSSSDRSTAGALSPQAQIGSPQRPLAVPSPQREQFQPVVGSPHQVTRDEITLQEPPPVSVLPDQIPQMDLPRFDGTELDMNLASMDQVPLTVQDLLPAASTPAEPPREKRRRSKRRQDKDKQTEVPVVPEPVQEQRTPERRPSQELPETRAVPPSPGVTLPVITSPLPRRQQINLDPLELVEGTGSPARRRKRRQLGFADAETQIPKTVMKENLTNTADILTTFVLPSAKPSSVSDMLNLPSGRQLNHRLLLPLWRRNAETRRKVAETETPEASSPSDVQSERAAGDQAQPKSPEFIAIQLPRLEQAQLSPVLPQPDISGAERPSVIDASVEALRQASLTGTAIIEDIEMSAVEQARDISTSTIEQGEQISLDGSLLQDSAKKDSTKKRRKTRSTSLVVEQPDLTGGSVPSASISQTRTLYDVQEELEVRVPEVVQPPMTPVRPPVEIPATILEEVTIDPAQARQTLLREVRDDLSGGDVETTFRQLCPPALTDRKTAAIKFSALLDLCGEKKLKALQTEAYGDIQVSLQRRRND